MFRGFPHIPTNPCRYCKGTARIKGDFGEHECTSCNGTGIDGEPFYGLLALIGFMLVMALVAILVLNR
jgi:hypothetical protein